MPIKPLTTVAAVLTPLAIAGVVAVSADSHPANEQPTPSRTQKGSTGPTGPTAPATQLSTSEQVQAGVVRIVGRNGDGASAGTGFVYDAAKGYIVTNAHVVQDLSAIKVTSGESEVPGRLVATAPCDDLAVVQVLDVPEGMRALPLGDSNAVKTSQHVRAFGFPAGLDMTQMSVTDGNVSAAGVSGSPGGDLPNFPSTIQHQAPINPGNSGGPLVDDQGRVIGVNTLGSSATDGQAYAISSDHVKSVVTGLLAGRSKDDVGWTLAPAGDLKFSWQGEYATAYQQRIVDDGLGNSMYALNVKPGSAAAQAGVQPGDLITAVEGSPVQSFGDVCDIVQSRTAGQIVSVEAIAVDRNDDSEPFTPLTPMALKLR